MHRVLALAGGGIAVTTGDLAGERRLHRSAADGTFRCLSPAWSGFVAALERRGVCHFGTDLPDHNGLVAYRRGLDGVPEFRALPPALDFKVRAIVSLDDGTLVALLGTDRNLPQLRAGRRPALLASRDDGANWSVVHRFAADWSDEPEDLVPLCGARAWAIGSTVNHAIAFAPRGDGVAVMEPA